MFRGLGRLGILVIGLLVLVAPVGAVGQESSANTTNQSQLRTWTDRSGTHRTEASFVEFADGKVTLKKTDGTTIKIALESLSGADRELVQQIVAGSGGNSDSAEEPRSSGQPGRPGASSRHGRNGDTTAITPSGGKRSARTTLPQAKEVIVTGVGTDPEKAIQNAFSQAIEQVVGLLVDAESVVKNDQLIHDEVLTYSRGYMEKYEVVRRWQEGGLHHAKIRAVVARDKLVEKLRGMKIAVQQVSGDLASRQINFDVKNEEQAAEMFKKALAGFDMATLTNVTIVGKPEIKREGSSASVRVKIQLSPDEARWNELAKELRQILTKTSSRRASIVIAGGEARTATMFFGKNVRGGFGKGSVDEAGNRLKQQLGGEGVLVALFKSVSTDGGHMEWEVFRVPESLEGAIKASFPPTYRVTCALLDESGGQIARVSDHVRGVYVTGPSVQDFDPCWREVHAPWLGQGQGPVLEKGRWIGPVWSHSTTMSSVLAMEMTLSSISQDDLGRLAKTAVFLEEDGKRRTSTRGVR
jgi:hypothetical protein